jgi:putative pyruvate formate lyase activating enzyme
LAGLYIARASTSILRHSCESGNLFRSGDPRFRGDDNFSDTKVFNLPIVYNTSGYDGMESLKFLDGVVDVYMPDIKYSANDVAEHYSSAKNYWEVVRGAIKEMYRQVGDLELDDDGIAKSGLIIRHMVLPNRLSGTEKVLKFIAEEISPKTHISLMSQYFPAQDALNDAHINRRLTADEWAEAKALLEKYGLENGWTQDL